MLLEHVGQFSVLLFQVYRHFWLAAMNCFVTYWTKGLSDKIPSTSETTGEIAERQANMLTLASTQLLLTCLYMGLLPSLICNRIVLCLSKLLFSTHSPRAGRSHTWSRESFFVSLSTKAPWSRLVLHGNLYYWQLFGIFENIAHFQMNKSKFYRFAIDF